MQCPIEWLNNGHLQSLQLIPEERKRSTHVAISSSVILNRIWLKFVEFTSIVSSVLDITSLSFILFTFLTVLAGRVIFSNEWRTLLGTYYNWNFPNSPPSVCALLYNTERLYSRGHQPQLPACFLRPKSTRSIDDYQSLSSTPSSSSQYAAHSESNNFSISDTSYVGS